MNFKNMKIEINENQPLDEIVMELQALGYYQEEDPVIGVENFIHTYNYGGFDYWYSDLANGSVVTIAELKEMK